LDVINHTGFSTALCPLWQANNRIPLCRLTSARSESSASGYLEQEA